MSKIASGKPETRPAPVSSETAAHASAGTSSGRLNWSLPSGESLAEFALRFGFLAPPLLGSKSRRIHGRVRLREVR